MDQERKQARLKKTVKDSLASSLSLLKNEIELGGRRLIVKESVSKAEATNMKDSKKIELQKKKEAEDKRNLDMAKEGLLNEDNWIN